MIVVALGIVDYAYKDIDGNHPATAIKIDGICAAAASDVNPVAAE